MRFATILLAVLAFAGCRSEPAGAPPCEAPDVASVQPESLVQTRMKGVHFRATETIAMDIEELRGELVRTNEKRPPDTEDPASYRIRLREARISVSEKDVADDFRDYVLAGTGAPIEGLTVRVLDGEIEMRGEMSPGVPFRVVASVDYVPDDDGTIVVKTENLESAGVGMRGVSEKTGVTLERIIGSHPERGVVVDGNDMRIDPRIAFPQPHLEGRLVSARARDGAIALVFESAKDLSKAGRDPLPDPGAAHFLQHYGGTLANGKVVVHGADQRNVDADESDPFDYSQPLYSSVQLPASKIHVTPKGETTILRVPDLDDVREDVGGRE